MPAERRIPLSVMFMKMRSGEDRRVHFLVGVGVVRNVPPVPVPPVPGAFAGMVRAAFGWVEEGLGRGWLMCCC